MSYFYTSDEHYGHLKIIEYCGRPFTNCATMNEALIANFNSVVTPQDVTVHCGDFCWYGKDEAQALLKRLNGSHILLRGSHNHWLPASAKDCWRGTIEGQFIVACHYAMRTWERACYGAWQVYGHSHGQLAPIGKQWDVGVDNNNFLPVSFEQLKSIMENTPMLVQYEHGGHNE